MRFVGLFVMLVGCCSWSAAPAWAGHTVTPPGLPPGWGASSSKSDIENDPASPAYKLGVGIVNALNKGDARAAANFVNARALAKRIAEESMYTSAEQQRALANSHDSRFVQQVFESHCATLQRSHGSAKFMRVVMHAGQPRALVRLDAGSEGVDYLEFLVDRDDSGEYRAIDWYQLTQGRLVSQGLGAMIRLVNDPNQSFLHRLFATTSFNAETMDKLRQLGALDRQGKYAESVALMNQLPPDLADSLEMLRLRVADAAHAKDNAEYYRVLGILARKYGDDPSVALLLMDYYLREKQFDKVQTGFTIIENRVGSDGLTNMMRSNFCQQMGAYDQGVTYARKAVELEPDLRRAWLALASGYLLQKNYPQAVATYRTMQTRFGLTFTREQFASNPNFGPLVQSDAFKKWLPR
jgi:tetratricopeptide (TPR) repeat protein